MARIFIDGFEAGSLDLWDDKGNGTAVATGIAGMDGAYCLDCQGNGSNQKYLRKNIDSKSELYAAFRYRPSFNSRFFSFYKDTTLLGKVDLTGLPGAIRAYRGTTLIATGTQNIVASSTYLIEIRFKPHDTVGVFQIKVNGLLDIDFSGDTAPGDSSVNSVLVSHNDSNWPPGYFDNLILDDANWIGDTRIQALVPNGPGATTQWTPSSGENWDCMNEVPPADSDFVSVNANDRVDTYALTDALGVVNEVKCIQVQARAVREGQSVPANLKLALRAGGVDYFSGDQAVPFSTPKGLSHIWETNPNTGAPWTEGDLNTLEAGFKSAA